jgi:hypothetical protein
MRVQNEVPWMTGIMIGGFPLPVTVQGTCRRCQSVIYILIIIPTNAQPVLLYKKYYYKKMHVVTHIKIVIYMYIVASVYGIQLHDCELKSL